MSLGGMVGSVAAGMVGVGVLSLWIWRIGFRLMGVESEEVPESSWTDYEAEYGG